VSHRPNTPTAPPTTTTAAPTTAAPTTTGPSTPLPLLGGLSATDFLQRHWQKEPLLIRGAVPGFTGVIDAVGLARLAGRRDAVARAVTTAPSPSSSSAAGPGARGRRRPRYRLQPGPLRDLDLERARREAFTFLVQGVEQHVPAAWDLLARFSFLPWARIDDLMISWASPGGGVGPHVDDYDVFLLQGSGRRRWQIAAPGPVVLDPDEDLRIVRDFRPTAEWVLAPGDMLYLPPGVPHWGTAVDECMTLSVGFLAPRHEQLAQNFLAFLSQQPAASPPGLYADPDLRPCVHPGAVDDDAVARVEAVLRGLQWDRDVVGTFLGRLLTGPKPTTTFQPPKKPWSVDEVAARLARPGVVRLGASTRMLFRGDRFFVNGEVVETTTATTTLRSLLTALADHRRAPLPCPLATVDVAIVHALYAQGFVVFA
jgi:50S ribosomal protein L16 3-hydroxylase